MDNQIYSDEINQINTTPINLPELDDQNLIPINNIPLDILDDIKSYEETENIKKNQYIETIKILIIDIAINNIYNISQYTETIIITNENNLNNQSNFKLILPNTKFISNNYTITIKSFISHTIQVNSDIIFLGGKKNSFINSKSLAIYKYVKNNCWVRIM